KGRSSSFSLIHESICGACPLSLSAFSSALVSGPALSAGRALDLSPDAGCSCSVFALPVSLTPGAGAVAVPGDVAGAVVPAAELRAGFAPGWLGLAGALGCCATTINASNGKHSAPAKRKNLEARRATRVRVGGIAIRHLH